MNVICSCVSYFIFVVKIFQLMMIECHDDYKYQKVTIGPFIQTPTLTEKIIRLYHSLSFLIFSFLQDHGSDIIVGDSQHKWNILFSLKLCSTH